MEEIKKLLTEEQYNQLLAEYKSLKLNYSFYDYLTKTLPLNPKQ
jgi:hypothetical protein